MKQFVFALLAILVIPAAARAECQSGHSFGHDPFATGSVMFAPPPGTVGQTYSRVSHPIPEDEHPRSAMLAVRDQGTVKFLRTERMGGFRMKNGIWLFEASRPLFPGQDHVVRVEARHAKADIQPYKVKFVRLIPGRIVYLDF